MKKIIDFNSADPKTIQKSKNIVIFGIFGLFLLIIIFGLLLSSKKKTTLKIKATTNNKNKIEIADSLNVKVEDEWLNKSESELSKIHAGEKNMQNQIEQLQKDMEKQKEESAKIINMLTQEIAQLHQYATSASHEENSSYDDIIKSTSDINTVYLDLEGGVKSTEDSPYKNLDDYIPAGSYAKARMLSGADVSTGVNNQNDPNNMLFEIISPISVPKSKGNTQEIKKVEGCRISGAAVGQLWTEKAYIRLLKMTCSFEKGKIAEYNVKGYVTSFAKEGVRGQVVSREGYFTSMAFLSGAIEGIANVAKTAYSPTLDIQSNIATSSISLSDASKMAGASGFEKAATILSDYYIKRAEQYQPVIDVPTGVEVEIVFQEGVDLNLKNNDIIGASGVIKNSNQSINDIVVDNNKVGGF